MNTNQNCKTCQHWYNGHCDMVDWSVDSPPNKENDAFEIEIKISDDWGMNVKLRTGPDFGCVKHLAKE